MTKAKQQPKKKPVPKKVPVKKAKPLSVADILRKKQEEANPKPAELPKKSAPIGSDFLDKTKNKNDAPLGVLKTTEYLAFIEFTATPKEYREEQTAKEFASKIGVSVDSLTDWKKKSGFWQAVREARQNYIKENDLGTALVSLKRSIIKYGKAPEVKLLFQLADEYEEKSIVENRPTRLTPEQEAGFADRLKRWKAENLQV